VVLLGDAAACVGIGVGHGTGLAMGAAYVLAEELCAGAVGVALARYEARVRPVVERRQDAIEAAPPFAMPWSVGAWVRERWRALRGGSGHEELGLT
jgi:2-polyprenyl-6-methoxyphenol hydroxylase-like FAD-dependent oxidoreductase